MFLTVIAYADMGVRMQGGDISVLQKMVAAGFLGKKSGIRFYIIS
jgi:hypothetical protein